MQTSSDYTIARLERQVTELEGAQRNLQRRLEQLDSKQFSFGSSQDWQETFLCLTWFVAIIAFALALGG
jgi:hypothetical protein